MATLSSLTTSAGGGALRLLDRRVYTANGTWTKPADNAGNILAGVGKIVIAKVIGGGGGGSVNNGGGGGGYSEETWDISQLTTSVTCTVGAGSPVNTAGGDSSFGGYAFAGGGLPGYPYTTVGQYGVTINSNDIMGVIGATALATNYQSSQGGSGRLRGGAGAMGLSVYFVPNALYIYTFVAATSNGGTGGGGTTHSQTGGTIAPSAGLTAAANANSTVNGPGGGGNTGTVGKLYGGGGGANAAGGQGVVVVETWG